MKETLKITVKEAERLSVMRQMDKKFLTISDAKHLDLNLSIDLDKVIMLSLLKNDLP